MPSGKSPHYAEAVEAIFISRFLASATRFFSDLMRSHSARLIPTPHSSSSISFCMIERSFCALDAQPGPGQFQVQYVHCIRIPDCGPFNRETAARKLLFRLPETQTNVLLRSPRTWKRPWVGSRIYLGVKNFGERDGIRTHDLLIKSQLLYRLSYALPWARNAALEIARNIGRVPRPVNRKKTGFQGGFLERIRRDAAGERLSMPAPMARPGAASESPTITMG